MRSGNELTKSCSRAESQDSMLVGSTPDLYDTGDQTVGRVVRSRVLDSVLFQLLTVCVNRGTRGMFEGVLRLYTCNLNSVRRFSVV